MCTLQIRVLEKCMFIINRVFVNLWPIGQLYQLSFTDVFTLEFFETLSVGVSESSHGTILELLKKSQIFCSIQESLPGGAHKKNITIHFLLFLSSKWKLLHQQISS